MKNKLVRVGLSLALAMTVTAGVSACSGDSGSGSGSDTSAAEVQDIDVAEDLENARQAVLEALADDPSWAQVMLASDVDKPTEKYGLLVMPYTYSDACSRVQGTVTIEDGSNFTIEADSAATGQTYQIDQDGNITEVTE